LIKKFDNVLAEANFKVYLEKRRALQEFLVSHLYLFNSRCITSAWLNNLLQESLYYCRIDGEEIEEETMQALAEANVKQFRDMTFDQRLVYVKKEYALHNLIMPKPAELLAVFESPMHAANLVAMGERELLRSSTWFAGRGFLDRTPPIDPVVKIEQQSYEVSTISSPLQDAATLEEPSTSILGKRTSQESSTLPPTLSEEGLNGLRVFS
jgi:hypothetical protein